MFIIFIIKVTSFLYIKSNIHGQLELPLLTRHIMVTMYHTLQPLLRPSLCPCRCSGPVPVSAPSGLLLATSSKQIKAQPPVLAIALNYNQAYNWLKIKVACRASR